MLDAAHRPTIDRTRRASELGVLGARVADGLAGRAGTVVVRGEAGIGKTWLLDRLVETLTVDRCAPGGRNATDGRAAASAPPAGARDAVVLRLAAHPAEEGLPYAGLHQLLGPVGGRIAALPEPQRAAVEGALARAPLPPSGAFAVASGVHRLLTDAAEARPVLLVVDDVQWLDPATRQALFFAARRLDADRVALVLAARSPHRPDVRAARSATIDLAPLDDGAARTLVRRHHPGASVPAVEAIVAAAQGLPLALVEIPAGLTEAQLRTGIRLPDPLPLGSRLGELYAARLAVLPDDALLALLVASLEPLRPDQLASALGELGLALGVLDGAERTGLVRLGADGPQFPHAATATAVQAAATTSMRRRAHRVLASVLRGEPARRARHLAVLVQGPDPEVAEAWAAAADDAERRGAWLVAAQAHEAAAERRTGSANADADADRWRASVAYARAGAATSLVDVLRARARTTEDPSARLALEAELVAAQAWAGGRGVDVDGARALSDRLGRADALAAARLHTVVAIALVISGRAVDARHDLAAARGLVPDPGDPVLAVTYDLLDAYLAGSAGFDRLVAWAEGLTDAQLAVPSLELVAALSTLIWSDEPARADALLARQCRALRAVGALGQVGVSDGQRAVISQRQGDWARAEARFIGAVDRCTDTDMAGPLPHIQLRYAYLLAAQGRAEPCRALVDAACRADPASPLLSHMAGCVLGLLELSAGRPGAARELLDAAGEVERRAGINHPGHSTRAADLVEARWQLRDLAGAREVSSSLAAQAERWGQAGPLAAAARCRAMLGPDDDVDDGFAAAVALHRRAVDVYEEARTELAWGRRLRRDQRKRDARPHLRTALGTFERLGADPWAGRARSELAACGERRVAGRAVTADLTPRELEVAVVVARGASNPQAAAELCISRRTVEDHLGRVYRKLGVADRHALARVLSPLAEAQGAEADGADARRAGGRQAGDGATGD
ncbi:MAG TPA: LuxR family transcriptional regulator [Acidimicrobiales bacterium]|nr:LuxR family transcriptional regulator [Acidimicrobiales bacterium]